MTDKKGWGSTVLGWFIVQDEQSAGEESPLQVSDAAASELDPSVTCAPDAGEYGAPTPTPTLLQSDALTVPVGNVDFDAVFEAAGVGAEERQRVDKAIALLRTLPAGTDIAVKRQIVEASLSAFGVPIEKIIEAGVGEIQALEYHIRAGATDTEKLIQLSHQRIQEYEGEIRKIRTIIAEREQEQKGVVRTCNEKKLEVQQILEFFDQETVARVVKESPKLHDPSTPEGSEG